MFFKDISSINEDISVFFWIDPATKLISSINFVKDDDVSILDRPIKFRQKISKINEVVVIRLFPMWALGKGGYANERNNMKISTLIKLPDI